MRDDFTATFKGRPSTVHTYTSLYRNHLQPKESNLSLDELSHLAGFEALVEDWSDEELSPQTIKQLVSLTRRWVQWQGGSAPDTAPLVRRIMRSKQEREIKALTREQARTLLDYYRGWDSPMYLVCLLGLHLGLRRGEMFGLQYGDFDALNNRVLIQRSYNGPTKNGRNRWIPLSAELGDALGANDYLMRGAEERLLPQVFNPNMAINEVCKKYDLGEGFTCHSLRHTFATLALESGVSPKVVSQWLGHRKVSTTIDMYWSALPNETKMDFVA